MGQGHREQTVRTTPGTGRNLTTHRDNRTEGLSTVTWTLSLHLGFPFVDEDSRLPDYKEVQYGVRLHTCLPLTSTSPVGVGDLVSLFRPCGGAWEGRVASGKHLCSEVLFPFVYGTILKWKKKVHLHPVFVCSYGGTWGQKSRVGTTWESRRGPRPPGIV